MKYSRNEKKLNERGTEAESPSRVSQSACSEIGKRKIYNSHPLHILRHQIFLLCHLGTPRNPLIQATPAKNKSNQHCLEKEESFKLKLQK